MWPGLWMMTWCLQTCSIGFTWALYQTCRISVSAQTYRLRIKALKIFSGESNEKCWLSWAASLEESRFSHSYRVLSWANQTLSHIPMSFISILCHKWNQVQMHVMCSLDDANIQSRPTYLALVKRKCMTWGQTELGPNSSFPLWFWTITSPTELPITLQYSESNTAPDRYKRKTKPETKNKTKTKNQRLFFINFWQEHPSAVLSFLHGFKDIRKKSKF